MNERRGPSAMDPTGLSEVVDRVVARVVRKIETHTLPRATYRLQFHSGFTFRDAEQIVPYLHSLGITHLYASPFLKARAGSQHGYDIVDHAALNPEIGTIEDLRSLHAALAAHGMGLIADVVPNHMGVASGANAWWLDVLENGPSSQYAAYFDIDWMPLKPDLADKLLLPVLGEQFGRVLEDGQLLLRYTEGAFWIDYFDGRFPIAPRSYALILEPLLDDLRSELGEENHDLLELLSILTAIQHLPPRSERDDERRIERRREKEIIKRRLHQLVLNSPRIARYVSDSVRRLNGQPGDPASFDNLDGLLQDQAYRLANWRTAADEINYRRFFDINDLAAICTEDPVVFRETHALIFSLLEEGIIAGLRIDHPDGLYDPRGYLRQLQEERFLQLCRREWTDLAGRETAIGGVDREEVALRLEERLRELWRASTQIPGSPLAKPLYLVVEKILLRDEALPQDWAVHGTVGYDHLNALNGLFIDADGERAMSAAWTRFTDESPDFDELAYRCKRLIVRMSMASELNVLGHRLDRVSEGNRWSRDFTLPSLTRALQEIVSCFGVYRTYVEPGLVLERDRDYIEAAVAAAKRRNPAMSDSVFDFVRDTLLLRDLHNAGDEERSARRNLTGKFQQLTGPIMARAIEDTVCYRYNRLVSLNEVGGEPAEFGSPVSHFHLLNQCRQQRHPHGLNGTSTHDTKRSEDVRVRIDVLSEIPLDWEDRCRRWARGNRRFKTLVDGVEAPGPNDEYLLYQTLVGTWPIPLPAGSERAVYVERIQHYMRKVVREAKVHTSWISPNDAYETALSDFVARLFEDDRRRSFSAEMTEFARPVADHGCWNALAQVVLKACSPGVPDFFQGSEPWMMTLVDPDNRRPVDFGARREELSRLLDRMATAIEMEHRGSSDIVAAWMQPDSIQASAMRPVERFLSDLIENRSGGQIKLFTTLLSLQARRAAARLMISGSYRPLRASGRCGDQIVAFAIEHDHRSLVVVAPRLTVSVVGFGGEAPLGDAWDDTSLVVPPSVRLDRAWNVFSRERVPGLPKLATSLSVANLLRRFPVAVILSDPGGT